MNRRPPAMSLLQASQEAPTLSRLMDLSNESVARLKAIAPLLPPNLRAGLQAGPIEGESWCLLVPNNAVAAKMRQLLPALQAHLRTKGWEVNAIRLKVQMGPGR
jgi:hypothetical protein